MVLSILGNKEEAEMQVMRRTCGYIGTNYWNKGRTAEIGDRVYIYKEGLLNELF